jgi:DNA/RNA endonuclease G (NUC1)
MDNNRYFRTPNPLTASAWFNIENRLQDRVRRGEELYIVAGSLGNNWDSQKKTNVPQLLLETPINQGFTNPTNFINNIYIPKWTWKTIVALPQPGADITSDTRTFTFITPNSPEPESWPQKHPLNQLLEENQLLKENEKRRDIESPEEWRNLQTWRISLLELQTLLNKRQEQESNIPFDFKFNFLSNISDENLRTNLLEKR